LHGKTAHILNERQFVILFGIDRFLVIAYQNISSSLAYAPFWGEEDATKSMRGDMLLFYDIFVSIV